MRRSSDARWWLLLLGFLADAGCSTSMSPPGSDGGSTTWKSFCALPLSCQEISQACMPRDDGTPGPVHDCHETGMQTASQTACQKDHDRCITLCGKAQALSDGPPEDLGAGCRDSGTKPKDGGR